MVYIEDTMADINDKIRILLVDDDEMMFIYFRDIFWIHGRSDTYDVIRASSLAEAEKKIADPATKPQTIFLDVMIPVLGEDNSIPAQLHRTVGFIEKIKKDPILSSTKIIIYSGQKEKEINDALRKVGIDDYLIKGEMMPKEIIEFTDKFHGRHN